MAGDQQSKHEITRQKGNEIVRADTVEAERAAIVRRAELEMFTLQTRVTQVQKCMKDVMKEDLHFGVIPGTAKKDKDGKFVDGKPTLLKPGAELLCMLFQLAPVYDLHREFDGDHLTVFATCTLKSQQTGAVIGEATGIASTKESKHRWRKVGRACPECGATAIKRSGFENRGGQFAGKKGWYCHDRAGGCGARFDDPDDPAIIDQPNERQENPDPADQWNTVEKMATKRALVAATLTATAASESFTQDLEDFDPPQNDAAGDDAPPREPRNGGNGNGRSAGGQRDSDRRPRADTERRDREPAPATPATSATLFKPWEDPEVRDLATPAQLRKIEQQGPCDFASLDRLRAQLRERAAASPGDQLAAAKARTAAVVESNRPAPAPTPERNDDSERAQRKQVGDYGLDGDEAIDPPAPDDDHRTHDDEERAVAIGEVINLPGQWQTLRDRAVAAGCQAPDLLMLLQQHFAAATRASDLPGRGGTRTDAYTAIEDHVEKCERVRSVSAK